MVRFDLVLSLLAAVAGVSVQAEESSAIPGAFMFEFEEGADVDLFRRSFGDHADVRKHINRRLFQGTSLQFRDVNSAETRANELASLPGVKTVYPLHMIDVPDEVVWRGKPGKTYSTLRRRDDHSDDNSLYDHDVNTPHIMTQVDKLRDKGYTGKGVRVAVVDSGIDYKHPALGGCYGKGCLVSYGRDLVDEGDDPMDCMGHGTHVAGIIAAQSNPFGFTGAAPGVELGAYKIFGCSGGAADETIIDAFYQAHEDGSDIINASLGGSSGWSSSLLSSTINRLTEKGVICIVAAGNEGAEGLFFGADPSAAESVSSVAAFENTRTPVLVTEATYETDDGHAEVFGFHPGSPAAWDTTISLPLYATSHDVEIPDDACDPLPEGTPDLSGYITLIRAGTCTYATKVENAVAHGAKYVVIYNNLPGIPEIDASSTDVMAVAAVEGRQGVSWVRKLNSGVGVTLHMVDPETSDDFLITVENTFNGGYLTDFTTWGPTWELNVKPNFGAPGGNILSTYPTALGNYAVLGGTSMATPLVAGAVALLCEARGTRDPVEIRNLLAASSIQARFHNGVEATSQLAPVPQQGAGLIQIYDAAMANAQLNVASISFNDSDHFISEETIEIRNTGSTDLEYEFDHRPAATVYTHAAGSSLPMKFPNDLVDDYATITLAGGNKFTVPAGKTVELSVRATPPKGLKLYRLPVWSGFINLHGSDGHILTLPYLGVSGSMYDQSILGTGTGIYYKNAALRENTTIELPYPGLADSTVDELPYFGVDVIFGCRQIFADLSPVSHDPAMNVTDSVGLNTVGGVFGAPYRFQTRSPRVAETWDGILNSGQYAAEDNYKLVVRALRNFGDPNKAEDYQHWESPVFRIKYKAKPARTNID
ncbi:minor extracellular protease vpr [Plectosphaerella plurivora]|uniref:Minor extracellular protease vpr n=1 Tax=Plectosphaerella plurivora TaxID=936078 RepID=A0A9P8VJV6_9PEZI|nr:minor extracellular protease vpr [Plectosphaerella plurivora]